MVVARCSSRCSCKSRSAGSRTPLAWMLSTPPSWFVPVATEYQIERWLRPTVVGEGVECYAITEEGAGSDVDAIEATARREADEYVLDGVKWHVTSYNEATWGFFQAKLTEGPACRRARDVHLRHPDARSECGEDSCLHAHHQPSPSDPRVRWRARARHPTLWARRGAEWPSPTNGSGSSGSWWRRAA